MKDDVGHLRGSEQFLERVSLLTLKTRYYHQGIFDRKGAMWASLHGLETAQQRSNQLVGHAHLHMPRSPAVTNQYTCQ